MTKDSTPIESKGKAKKIPANGFKKGVSGNPGGRAKRTPEEFELIAACKAKVPAALDTLVKIMETGENERNQLAAAQAIIERAYGKPVQPTELSGPNGNLLHS